MIKPIAGKYHPNFILNPDDVKDSQIPPIVSLIISAIVPFFCMSTSVKFVKFVKLNKGAFSSGSSRLAMYSVLFGNAEVGVIV